MKSEYQAGLERLISPLAGIKEAQRAFWMTCVGVGQQGVMTEEVVSIEDYLKGHGLERDLQHPDSPDIGALLTLISACPWYSGEENSWQISTRFPGGESKEDVSFIYYRLLQLGWLLETQKFLTFDPITGTVTFIDLDFALLLCGIEKERVARLEGGYVNYWTLWAGGSLF